MKEVLEDTDTISFYFKGDVNVVKHFREYLAEYDHLSFSIITYYEIIAGLRYKGVVNQIKEFDLFAGNNNVILVSEESARISGEIYAKLRQKGISIGTSDILIAGIVIENDFALVTNNERHYSHIEGLDHLNWKR